MLRKIAKKFNGETGGRVLAGWTKYCLRLHRANGNDYVDGIPTILFRRCCFRSRFGCPVA
jgi:hypothetical protein